MVEMRSLRNCVVVLALLAACGGAQKDRRWWMDRYLGFLATHKQSVVITDDESGVPVQLAVVSRPTPDLANIELLNPRDWRALAHISNATGVFLSGHTWVAIQVKPSATSAPQWRLATFTEDHNGLSLKSLSPPLLGVERFAAKILSFASYGPTKAVETDVNAIVAGTEPGLYLPLTEQGDLAPLPAGALGAKPILWTKNGETRWKGWLIKTRDGWMLSLDPEAKSLVASTVWKDASVNIARAPAGLELQIICGTRSDGTYDVSGEPMDPDDHRAPIGTGATCDAAFVAMLAHYQAIADATYNARREKEKREATDKARLPADARAYEAALDKLGLGPAAITSSQTPFPDSVCALARTFSHANHTAIVANRGPWLAGELECLLQRPDITFEDGDTISMRETTLRQQQWDRDAAARRAREDREMAARNAARDPGNPGAPSSSYDDHGVNARTNSIEEQIRAQEAYSHGGGGLCPFADRSLCH